MPKPVVAQIHGPCIGLGAELALAFQPTPQWTFFANATYTYGQNQSVDAPLRFIPPNG